MRPSSPRSIESSSKFSSANYDLTREQEIVVKQRIKDILYSVKEEKQHIENIMFQNEANIKRFTAEYEAMKMQNDFEDMSKEELLILYELQEGLKQAGIDPKEILGKTATNTDVLPNRNYKQLSKAEIIQIQKTIMNKLVAKIDSKQY